MTCSLYYFWVFKFDIKCITNFLKNYQSQKKMHVTKNVYLDEVCKLYLAHFAKYFILVEINANNHDFYGFYGFTMKIEQSAIFTITFIISASKYVKMGSLMKIGRFTYSKLHPLQVFAFVFLKIPFFSKNNALRAKTYGTLKINLFIRYNFCTKYFFPGSILFDIK